MDGLKPQSRGLVSCRVNKASGYELIRGRHVEGELVCCSPVHVIEKTTRPRSSAARRSGGARGDYVVPNGMGSSRKEGWADDRRWERMLDREAGMENRKTNAGCNKVNKDA